MGIYILSREVRSGKTTELMNAFANSNTVAGVLMPDIKGVRHIYELASKNIYQVQLSEKSQEAESIQVGRFSFSKLAFQQAEQAILEALKTKPEWLILDEVGKLELQNSGFHHALNCCLQGFKSKMFEQLILVVRDSLCPLVIEKYNLQEANVIQDLTPLNSFINSS